MNESEYIKQVTQILEHLSDTLEEGDVDHMLDVELVQGVLTITTESEKQFVINQHLPTKQIWVSSPISGAAHYSYHESSNRWIDSQGKDMYNSLSNDLNQLGLNIDL